MQETYRLLEVFFSEAGREWFVTRDARLRTNARVFLILRDVFADFKCSNGAHGPLFIDMENQCPQSWHLSC